MLSTKEITEKFEVSRATLHNWKSTKPNLYNLLQTADDQFSKYREVNILLDRYIQTVPNVTIFEYKELEYILKLELENQKLEEIDNLHLNFINKSLKIEKQTNTFSLDIYKKLEKLNLIEKYIFVDKLKIITPKIKVKKEEKESLIKHYFKSFIESEEMTKYKS